jgi:hypothetical protein
LDLYPSIPESAQDENELEGDDDGNYNDNNDDEGDDYGDDDGNDNDNDNNDDEGGDYGDDTRSTEVHIDEEDLLERLQTLFNICRECLLAKINTGQTPQFCMECLG